MLWTWWQGWMQWQVNIYLQCKKQRDTTQTQKLKLTNKAWQNHKTSMKAVLISWDSAQLCAFAVQKLKPRSTCCRVVNQGDFVTPHSGMWVEKLRWCTSQVWRCLKNALPISKSPPSFSSKTDTEVHSSPLTLQTPVQTTYVHAGDLFAQFHQSQSQEKIFYKRININFVLKLTESWFVILLELC